MLIQHVPLLHSTTELEHTAMRPQAALELVVVCCLVCHQQSSCTAALRSISQPQDEQQFSSGTNQSASAAAAASDGPTAIFSRLREAEPQVRKLSVRSLSSREQLESQRLQSNASSLTEAPAKRTNSSSPICPLEQAAERQQQSLDQDGELAGNQSFQFGQQRGSFGFVQSRPSDFVKPNFYTLRLKLDPNKRKFGGQLMISLEVGQLSSNSSAPANQTSNQPEAFRYLTLHAGSNLSIKKAFYVYTARNNVQIPATKIGRNFELELLTLDFHPNVIASSSQGLLLLVYSGLVNETDSHGLFAHHRSNHVWGSSKQWLQAQAQHHQQQQQQQQQAQFNLGLATQLEPSFARRLFPCWDEPSLKARFSLIVIQPFRGYESISNMPIKRKSISLSCSGEPLQEVEFHTTPTMSTYLLTLVIGKFEHIESITQNNCKVRAYFYANSSAGATPAGRAPPLQTPMSLTQQQQMITRANANELAQMNQRRQAARLALELAVKTFDWLEGVLGVRYPLAKFDMVALRDFNSGAMENWGASIFHENYMLCDNSSLNANIRVNGGTSRPKRLVVPLVVAHEIVHQWFGNLITSRTWTYLWLNEGFAQLLMYEVASALLPRENYWHIFLEDNRQSAMREDELITSSRALELNDEQLLSQDDQMSLFDQLTYNKGAMLLRMVQHALGQRDFMAGLRHYLLKHSYDSVTSHDLWLALEESSGRLAVGQLEQLMQNWPKLEGFPLVNVRAFETDPLQDNSLLRLELSQERFTLLPEAATQQRQTGSNQSNEQPWADWLWSIPIGLASELAPEPKEFELRLWPLRPASGLHQSSSLSSVGNSMLLHEKSASFLLPKAALGAWLKLNFNALGYFRVNYEHEPSAPGSIDLLARLRAPIRQQTLNAVDRFNLLDDLFSMVLSGRKRVVEYLRLVAEAFDSESEPVVLRFIFDSLERVRRALVSNSANSAGQLEELFGRYVRNFVRKLIGALRARWPRDMSHHEQEEAAGGELAPGRLALRLHTMAKRRRETAALGPLTVGANSANNNQKQQRADESWLAFISMEAALKRQLKQRPIATSAAGPAPGQPANENNFDAGTSSTSSEWPELLELLDSIRLTYNDAELGARQAVDLFARLHFRSAGHSGPTQLAPGSQANAADSAPSDGEEVGAGHRWTASSSGSGSGAAAGPFELMGRELRASIYAAALNYHFRQHAAAAPAAGATAPTQPAGSQVDELFPAAAEPGSMPAIRNSPPATLSNYFAGEPSDDVTSSPGSSAGQRVATLQQADESADSTASLEDRVFNKLLELYETLDGSPAGVLERSAIAQALGNVRNTTKQAHLLNLTLASAPAYFRHQDASLLLEALTQSRSGRQLVWQRLNTDIKPLKQRQLFAAALKAVSRGLIEPIEFAPTTTPTQQEHDQNKNNADSRQPVEWQLRQLYVIYGAGEHGNLIGQAIEWVRINSLWFKRDHDQLIEFLEQSN